MQIEAMTNLLETYALSKNEGLIIDSFLMKQIDGLHELPVDYLWMVALSNGIRLRPVTFLETYDDLKLSFNFGEFLSWNEVINCTKNIRDIISEYGLSVPCKGFIYIGETLESCSILLGVEVENFGHIYLFSQNEIFGLSEDEPIPMYKIADSLESFLLNLSPVEWTDLQL